MMNIKILVIFVELAIISGTTVPNKERNLHKDLWLELSKIQHVYEQYKDTRTFDQLLEMTGSKQTWDALPESIRNFGDFPFPIDIDTLKKLIATYLGPYIAPLSSNASISEECRAHSYAYVYSILDKEWAMSMFDSDGKLPDGILIGNTMNFGNFDECLSVDVNLPNVNVSEKSFIGKYCPVVFVPVSKRTKDHQSAKLLGRHQNVGILPAINGLLPTQPGPTLNGMCIPSSCTAQEFQNSLQQGYGDTTYVSVQDCQTKNSKIEYDAGDIVMITIFVVTGIVICVGTFIDVIKQKAKNDNAYSKIYATIKMGDTTEKVFLAFSLLTNGRKLFNTKSTSDTLSCLHGIRFLSMTWVILGHNYFELLVNSGQVRNNNFIGQQILNEPAMMAVINGTFSVDSFFFLSGLLVAYIFYRNIERHRFNLLLYYLHRYIRLTPVLAIIIGFAATLYRHVGSGPLWPYIINDENSLPQVCQKDWWKHLLYVNTFNGYASGSCIGQTWYLANDMQLFVFSPLFLFPLVFFPIFGQIWLILLIIASILINIIITNKYDLPYSSGDEHRYFKAWCRAGPYIVGIYVGWVLHKLRGKKVRWPLPGVVIGWLVASLVGCLIVYGTYHIDEVKTTNIIYGSFSRTAWSVCLAWVVLACVTGHGGHINSILSWSALVPLSRLTYTGYLTSLDIQGWFLQTVKSPVVFDETFAVFLFLSSLVVIFCVALCFSLAFEAPMIALEKIIFPAPSAKKKHNQA